jgi:hypothetical protein
MQQKARIEMDFFEQWFHISPDGGNGSLEALYIIAIVAVILAILFRRRLGDLFARYAQHPGRRGDGNRP